MECTHSKVYSDQIEANCKPTCGIDIFYTYTVYTAPFININNLLQHIVYEVWAFEAGTY